MRSYDGTVPESSRHQPCVLGEPELEVLAGPLDVVDLGFELAAEMEPATVTGGGHRHRGPGCKPRPRSASRYPGPSGLHQFDGQTSVAVVNVTTSGRMIWPLKRSWMNASTSSKSPLRSPGFIIWVPEYDSINLR